MLWFFLPSVLDYCPVANQRDLYNWQDDFSFVKGHHTIPMGGPLQPEIHGPNRAITPGIPVDRWNGRLQPLQGGGEQIKLYGISDFELLEYGFGMNENLNSVQGTNCLA